MRAATFCAPGWRRGLGLGGRHRRTPCGKNGFCTQIGNDGSPGSARDASKSRLNFLDLLRAGHTDYVINDAAWLYARPWPGGAVIARLLAAINRRGSPIRPPGRRISTASASPH